MQDDFLNIDAMDWGHEKNITICIISIIKEEMLEIVKAFNMTSKNGNYIYWEGSLNGYPNIKIHCYQQNEPGNIDSEQLTKYVLEKHYDYYFCIGTAGAVDAKLYDVIIADQVVYLEKGANVPDGKEFDGKALEITEKEKNLINTFLVHMGSAKKTVFAIDKAPVFSGEKVERNPRAIEITEGKNFARHLGVIDMESYGVFRALRFYESFGGRKEKSVIIFRGVSDKADMLKNSVYEDGISALDRKKRAMDNVLEILIEFILFLKDFND